MSIRLLPTMKVRLRVLLHKSVDGEAWTEDEFNDFMANLMGVSNVEESDEQDYLEDPNEGLDI